MKFTIDTLRSEFNELLEYKMPINSEAEQCLFDNLNELLAFIQEVKWKSFAAKDHDRFPAVGTIAAEMVSTLHVAYELHKRGYSEFCYSLLRKVLDSQDLLHVFFDDSQMAVLWYKDSDATKPGQPLAPRAAREKIGKNKNDLHNQFSKSVHPTSHVAHYSMFAVVEEDGEEKSARLDTAEKIKRIILNVGGNGKEGSEWTELMFINALVCQVLSQLHMYLSPYIHDDPDRPIQAMERSHQLTSKLLPVLLKEGVIKTKDDALQYYGGMLVASMGDEVTVKKLSQNAERMEKIHNAVTLSAEDISQKNA